MLSLELGGPREEKPSSPFWMCWLLFFNILLVPHSPPLLSGCHECLWVSDGPFWRVSSYLWLCWVSVPATYHPADVGMGHEDCCALPLPIPLEVQPHVLKTVGLAGFLTSFLPSCGSAAMHRWITFLEPSLMTPRSLFKSR